jgi:hemerythrin-like domain-containing protein
LKQARSPLAEALEADHRKLDDCFGRFLAAVERKDPRAAGDASDAIDEFDEALRRHTALEEEQLYSKTAGGKLASRESETAEEKRAREPCLEHVQIREVSGMIRRLLKEKEDLVSARGLAANLARRWDAHTTREEREVFPFISDMI